MESVEVPLTEREMLVYGEELVSLNAEEEKITARHQSEKSVFKGEVEKISERAGTIYHRLGTKKEFKEIECYNDS